MACEPSSELIHHSKSVSRAVGESPRIGFFLNFNLFELVFKV